jgi:diguanylate cyclase (GGDEF)-like protein
MIKIIRILVRLFGAMFLLAASTAVHAQHEIRILVLLSLDVTYPYVKSKVDGLAYEGARNSESVLLDIHSIEDKRFNDQDKLRSYYMSKARQFKNSHPDVIVVTGSPVIFDFYNRYVYPLMPDVPMVGETRITPTNHKPDSYSFIEYHQNMPTTIEMALSMRKPDKAYLIGDANHPGSILGMDLVEKNLSNLTDIPIERLDMPIEQLLKTVPKLPANSIGFYNLIFSDGHGNLIIPEKALERIAPLAPFPIFAFHETMVGSGATGGVVAKGEDVGIQMIREALTVLQKGPFMPPRIVPATSTALFDGNYLDRFNIAQDDIPRNAEIINHRHSILDLYLVEIATGLVIIIIQFILVSMLIIYSNQKKILSKELITANIDLEERIDERTSQLVLINDKLVKKEQEIVHLLLTDALTNIPNRRSFEDEVHREFSRSERANSDFCIGICDIDNFKLFNDQYGHDIGDKVLIEVAKTIRATIRKSDFVARWGGEEFVIMFIETDHKIAQSISERIRQNVANIRIGDKTRSITISLGLAQRHRDDSFDQLFKRADQALYVAKDAGRNQVINSDNLEIS